MTRGPCPARRRWPAWTVLWPRRKRGRETIKGFASSSSWRATTESYTTEERLSPGNVRKERGRRVPENTRRPERLEHELQGELQHALAVRRLADRSKRSAGVAE